MFLIKKIKKLLNFCLNFKNYLKLINNKKIVKN